MATINVSEVTKTYKGMWVAYKNDRKTVVASGRTARIALANARKLGVSNPILAKIPTRVLNYVGGALVHEVGIRISVSHRKEPRVFGLLLI